jgi:hypothetical protein
VRIVRRGNNRWDDYLRPRLTRAKLIEMRINPLRVESNDEQKRLRA